MFITLRGQILHSVQCKRIQQQAKIEFVPKYATTLLFWSSLLFWIPQTNTYNTMALNIAPKIGKFAEAATVFAELGTVCGIHEHITRHVYS